MPLFALLGQLTSICSLKSCTFCLVAIFDPADRFTIQPFSTSQPAAFDGLSKVHPVKSRPLNREIGFPHFGFAGDASAGARLPVQVQAVPFGPWACPLSLSPVNVPSN